TIQSYASPSPAAETREHEQAQNDAVTRRRRPWTGGAETWPRARDEVSAEDRDSPAEDQHGQRRHECIARAAKRAVVGDIHRVEELIDRGEDQNCRADPFD